MLFRSIDNHLQQMDGASLFVVPDDPANLAEMLSGKTKMGDELTRTAFTPATETKTEKVPLQQTGARTISADMAADRKRLLRGPSASKVARDTPDPRFSKFTTASQAINHISKTGNKVQQAWARRLKNFVKDVEFVVLEEGDELPPMLARHADQWDRSIALFIENYDTGARAIFVRGESFGADQGINNVTILHELLHAGTNRKIALAEESVVAGKLDTELVRAYKMLLRTMRSAQNEFADQAADGSLPDVMKDLYTTTGGEVVGDPREFLAYGLTDEGMQDFLAMAPGFVEEPSLLSNFVRSIRSFFGVPKNEHNALTNLISATDSILDRKSTRLNSSHMSESRMPSSA